MSENTIKKDRPILLIDGMNCFVRHYLVNGAINSRSEPIGGVVGFLRALNYLNTRFSPGKIYVAWETGGGSARRRSVFKEYKKNRAPIKEFKKIKAGEGSMRDQLVLDEQTKVQQLSLLYRLLKNTPVCQVFVSGTEADDIIAYLATQYFRTSNCNKIVVSNDKDFYQLLEDKSITIYDHAKRAIIDGNKIMDTYGIAPRNFCMARALVGDTSDNLNGVPGVGLKTAVKRFPQLADSNIDLSIPEILQECDNKIKAKARQKVYTQVKENEDVIRRNWKLMYLSSGMLSAKEIAKIDHILETHEPKMNKVALIKDVLTSGISIAFDFDSFCSQLKNLTIY